MSLQPCKRAVQTGRHTPCLPTARPQPSHHLCPCHSTAENCHVFQGHEASNDPPCSPKIWGWDQ